MAMALGLAEAMTTVSCLDLSDVISESISKSGLKPSCEQTKKKLLIEVVMSNSAADK